MRERVIWKYPLPPLPGIYRLDMPHAPVIRSVDNQQGVPVLWAEVNPEFPLTKVEVAVVFTGHEVPPPGFRFIGTILLSGGELVQHIYVKGDARGEG